MRKALNVVSVCVLLCLVSCSHSSGVVRVKTFEPTTTTTIASTTTSTTTTTIPSTTTTHYVRPDAEESAVGVWDRMASCEAHSNWSLNATYDGGLQFSPSTWTSYVAAGKPYALSGYPPYAYQASRGQQIVVAIRVRDGVKGSSDPYLNAQGWNAWPTCRYSAGV